MKQEVPDYPVDPHLLPAVKGFLRPLNAGGPEVESLSEQNARNVQVNLQASVTVDLSGIDESEKTNTQDGYTLKLTIVRPKEKKVSCPEMTLLVSSILHFFV
jgi:acetyl esterase